MARTIGKLFRLRADRLDKEDECLFCLPLGFRDALLDATQRMEWAATWVDENGDRQELTEQQKSIIELGIERLTMGCEIVVNNVFEVPAPNVTIEPTVVNVTVSGGGGGCVVNLPTLVDDFGEEIETVCLPVDPDNPTGITKTPKLDEGNQTPPDGWTDWQEFIDERCLLANYIADSSVQAIYDLDEAENKLSGGETILNIASIVLLLLPVAIGKGKGLVTIAKWVSGLAGALGLAANTLEPINDWLQNFREFFTEKRNDYVCFLSSYYLNPEGQLDALYAWLDGLFSEMDDLGLSQAVLDAAQGFVSGVLADIAPMVYSKAVKLYIPDDYSPQVDCDQCGVPEGYMLIPATLTQENISTSGNVQNQTAVLSQTAYGATVTASYDTDAGLDRAFNLTMVLDAVIAPFRIVGLMARVRKTEEVLEQNLYVLGNPGSGLLWDGGETLVPEGVQILLRSNHEAFYQGYTGLYDYAISGDAVNLDICEPAEQTRTYILKMYKQFGSEVGAHYEMVVDSIYWIVHLGSSC